MMSIDRARWLPVVRVAAPVVIIAVLWHIMDAPEVLARLGRADWRWLLAALAVAHAQIVLAALRWKLTAGRLGQHLPAGWAIGEYYLAQLVNQTLPGGVVGDAGRAIRARGQADMLRSGQAVVIERMLGQIALLAVTFCGMAFTTLGPGGLFLPPDLARTPLALMGAVLLIAAVAIILRWIAPRIVSGFGAALRRATLAPGIWQRQLALGLAIVGCNLATFALCARATGTHLPLVAVVTLVPLILTAMVLPVSVGGWGLREGAAGALFPLAAATPEAGVAASIAFGAVILLASLPGGFFLARMPRPADTQAD